MPVTIISEGRAAVEVEAVARGDELWIDRSALAQVTGWELRPEGLCRGEMCIPLPPAREDELLSDDDTFNLAAFARLRGQPVVRDDAGSAWVFGQAVPERRAAAESLEAPDFELPDLDGRVHALSEYRGKKVLILSWASWCGCRYDLPVWQATYDELKDEEFVLISVATDSGGAEAAGEWLQAAGATNPALIDERLVVTELYGLVNVPNAVWVDEEGHIVRPAESAGAIDVWMDRVTVARSDEGAAAWDASLAAYTTAVRDWVRTGRHALPAERVAQELAKPTEASAAAAAHHRLAIHLLGRGDAQAAQQHFAEALRLEPDRWTYRRDAWGLDNEKIDGSTPMSAQGKHGKDFWAAVDALDGRPFFPPAQLSP